MRRFLELSKFASKQQHNIPFGPAFCRELSLSGSSLSSGNSSDKQQQKTGGGQKKRTPMSATTSGSAVRLDQKASRFTMDLGNGQVARIEYKPLGGNKIEMYHTEVPRELRGKGIGKALAKGALEQAAANKMRVKLTCTYLIDYLDRFADPKSKNVVEE